jgi:DNA-binding phage protein
MVPGPIGSMGSIRQLNVASAGDFARALSYATFLEPSDPDRKGARAMPPTRSFRKTVQARARRDVRFRRALLAEAVQVLLDGDLGAGRAALRSSINATVGFEKLGATLGRSPKSLMRMFRPAGNPTAENLLGVIRVLQQETGVHLEVRAVGSDAV